MNAGKAIAIFWLQFLAFIGGVFVFQELDLQWLFLPLAIGYLVLVVWTYGKMHFG